MSVRFGSSLPTIPPDLPVKVESIADKVRTNATVRQKRSRLFEEEKKRQLEMMARVEKIEVTYKGVPEDAKLVLNKGLSTPYDVAQRE